MDFTSFLGTVITPLMLFFSSAAVTTEIGIGTVFSPKKLFCSMKKDSTKGNNSHLRALSVALAGTLGVGNITGVASAVIMGGSGAVFWMWVGAFAVLPIKYAETFLAVKYRRKGKNGFYGGAMYYIRDGLPPSRFSALLGGIFALLCCLNSIVTGNIVQSNAAACVFPAQYRLLCGIVLAALVLITIISGAEKVSRITSAVIPPLCAVYIIIALYVILSNISLLPSVFRDIFVSAFSFRAVKGGVVGFTAKQAMRYGVMRGIFSNEAGCGTSPTAHASADTDSSHSQATFGIIEVVFDTHILCTLTALVMLIADRKYSSLPWGENIDVTPITLDSFTNLTSESVYYILVGAIFLFAYSTVIAQLYYGTIAIRYFSDKKIPQVIYSVISVGACVLGSVISAPVMWTIADLLIGTMTAVNCEVIIMCRRRLPSRQ